MNLARPRAARAGLAPLLLAALLPGCGALGCRREPPPRNVVIFLIDTLRADRTGLAGRRPSPTPYLDELAAESVVFEQAYAPAPWTLPSTVSLLTSLPLCEHGVAVDGDLVPEGVEPLAERLRRRGRHTASFFANPYAGAMSGLDRGFAEAEIVVPGTDAAVVGPWLDRIEGEPFFLYVHNVEPHDPFESPLWAGDQIPHLMRQRINQLMTRYRKLTREDWLAGRPPGTTHNEPEQHHVATLLGELRPTIDRLYNAEIGLADARLRDVVEAIRERGRLDETVLFVVSDHGEAFGEHEGWQHDHALYEEVVRVPLLMRLPDGAHGGRRVAAPVSLLDVVPTLADLLHDRSLAEGARGRSLLPLLEGGDGAGEAEPRALATRWNLKKHYPAVRLRGDLNVAVREGRWKAIWNAEPGTVELFDLEADPEERRDLAFDEPEVTARLGAVAQRHARRCREAARTGAPTAPELDPETRRQLHHLGYLDE